MRKQLKLPSGLETIPLPPYSPELQPAEHLWELESPNGRLASRSSSAVRAAPYGDYRKIATTQRPCWRRAGRGGSHRQATPAQHQSLIGLENTSYL
jgi:hypothetical protein